MIDFASENKFTIGKQKTNVFLKIFKIIFVIFLVFFSFVYLFYLFFFQVKIYGSSMYPTFTDKNDEIAIVMRYFNLKHGDVIVVRMTSNLIIKRAVALGGDKISLVYDKESKYCKYFT